MPGSFAALISRGVWNMDSPNFALTTFGAFVSAPKYSLTVRLTPGVSAPQEDDPGRCERSSTLSVPSQRLCQCASLPISGSSTPS